MDEKKLEDLLQEMKQQYEQVPDLISNESVQNEVKPKQPFWKRLVPALATVAGLLLFVVMTITFMEPENLGEEQEDISEIRQYYLVKLEEFKEKLGIQNISNYSQVHQAEEFVRHFEKPENEISEERYKQNIDAFLQTPKDMLENMDLSSAESTSSLEREILNLTSRFTVFTTNTQRYLDKLLNENKINQEEQQKIIDQQEDYEGPEEIRNLIHMVNDQGLVFDKHPEYNNLYVKVNQKWLADKIDAWDISEVYKDSIQFLTSLTIYDNQLFVTGALWEELDDILLELEDIMKDYEGAKDSIFYSELINIATHHLNSFLFGDGSSEMAQSGLIQFLNNHPDSAYWSVVQAAVKEYERNSWRKKYSLWLESTELRILFDNKQFPNIQYSDIYRVGGGVVHGNPIEFYKAYEETLNQQIIKERPAHEMMKLFLYSVDAGDGDVAQSLVSHESDWKDLSATKFEESLLKFQDTYRSNTFQIKFVVEQSITADSLIFSFVNQDAAIIHQLDMIKEDGVWKVIPESF